jgi:molybdopterin converting factor small subunit
MQRLNSIRPFYFTDTFRVNSYGLNSKFAEQLFLLSLTTQTQRILFFGALTDIVNATQLATAPFEDTDSLCEWLLNSYPALKEQTYIISVDRKIVNANTPLTPSSEVALMSPFSGG